MNKDQKTVPPAITEDEFYDALDEFWEFVGHDKEFEKADGKERTEYNLGEFFGMVQAKKEEKKTSYTPYVNTDVKKDVEINLAEHIQKFIVECVHDDDEWYIIGYGTVEQDDEKIYYNVEDFIFPLQKRSGAAVDVINEDKALKQQEMSELYQDYDCILLIHSHNSMGVYFSKTDNDDIERFRKFSPTGCALVFAQPSKVRASRKDSQITIGELKVNGEAWIDDEDVDGKIIVNYDSIDLDFSSLDCLIENDNRLGEYKNEVRVREARKELDGVFVSEYDDMLSRRQCEALLWLSNASPEERQNFTLVLEKGEWLDGDKDQPT